MRPIWFFILMGIRSEFRDRLFLYKYDYNSLIADFYNIGFGPDVFGGNLNMMMKETLKNISSELQIISQGDQGR